MKTNISKFIVITILLIAILLAITGCVADNTPTKITIATIENMTDEQLRNEIDTRMTLWHKNNIYPDYIASSTVILMCQNELNKREILDAIRSGY